MSPAFAEALRKEIHLILEAENGFFDITAVRRIFCLAAGALTLCATSTETIPQTDPKFLISALAEARCQGLHDVAARLEATLFGHPIRCCEPSTALNALDGADACAIVRPIQDDEDFCAPLPEKQTSDYRITLKNCTPLTSS